MPEESDLREYLVLSRGQWDATASKEEVQAAIDAFYRWYDESVAAGLMKPGHRLAKEGKVVSRHSVTDGPFAETKEVVGGYWFIIARSLEEAVALAAQNPTLAYGLMLEVRPVEFARASVLVPANETPAQWTRGEV
ncbi:MAG TPA: YciI family protein [Vicinamibacterales bacterium]|nr:YciI family protein [Vicinamibacterales bacterium]